jgi:hypothetical protein
MPLHGIKLADLPGWPPTAKAGTPEPDIFAQCRLKSVQITDAPHPSVEMTVQDRWGTYTLACGEIPGPLLNPVVKTLTQAGVAGRRFSDLQRMCLVDPE